MEQIAFYQAPFSLLKIICAKDALLSVQFVTQKDAAEVQSALIREVLNQLHRFHRDSAFVFDLPIKAQGTAFQQNVWQHLRTIPVGTVQKYGEVSRALNTAARAVGGACRKNPVPIVVPCHRVVAAHGLGGFSGEIRGNMLSIKQWLLRHEGAL